MSGPVMKWARRQNVHSGALKAVVNAIAARADLKGATWISQATLAADTNMGERTIRRHLALLVELGVIRRVVRSAGRQGRLTDEISLVLHRSFDLSAADLRAAKKRLLEISNRPLSTLPTGQRWPGNRKGTTFPIHEGELTSQGKALGPGWAGDGPRLRVVGGLAINPNFYDDREIGF